MRISNRSKRREPSKREALTDETTKGEKMEKQEPEVLWSKDRNIDVKRIYNDDESFIKAWIHDEIYEGLDSLITDIVRNTQNYNFPQDSEIIRIDDNPDVAYEIRVYHTDGKTIDFTEISYEPVNVVRAVD